MATIITKFKNSHGTITDWKCDCGGTFSTSTRGGDTACFMCDQPYNAFGQKLRRDYHLNPSMYDENIGDMEGFEAYNA